MCDTVIFGRTGDIEYSLYKESDWEGVKYVMNEQFFRQEMMCRGVGIDLPASQQGRAELTLLGRDSLRYGVSIVARDVRSNRIVGHAVNKVLYRNTDPSAPSYLDEFKAKHCRSPNARSIIDLLCMVDGLVDLFEYFETDCLFEIMFLGTLPGYEGAGIGRALCEYSIGLAQQLKRGERLEMVSQAVREDSRRPRAATAIFTSAFSQRIGERLGFQSLATVAYADLEFEGRTYADRINDERHSKAVLSGLRL